MPSPESIWLSLPIRERIVPRAEAGDSAWTGPDGFRSAEPRVTVDKEGVYRLTITDSNGCQASDELTVTVKDIDISSEIVLSSDVFVGDTVVVVNSCRDTGLYHVVI